MKKSICKILSFVLCAAMLLSFAGCAKEVTVDIAGMLGKEKLGAGVVNENSRFTLSWDETLQAVILTDKNTGKIWSNVPEEFINLPEDEKETRVRNYLQSPFLVTYRNADEGTILTTRAYTESVRDGSYSSVSNNGVITITYYLKNIDALIPVSYELVDNGLRVSVNTNDIVEGKNLLYNISLMPFMNAVPTGKDDSYIFFPSGSGAVIDTSNSAITEGTYSSEVYGSEPARKVKEQLTNDKNVYLPTFGVKKDADSALCSIITSGAEQASITTTVKDSVTGYSYIAADFALRGYDYNIYKGTGGVAYETGIYSENIVKDTVFAVDYYPLYGDDADYMGMAKTYQNYLFGNNDGTDIKEDAVSVKFVGGLMEEEDILGFPYQTLLSLTTYKDISAILNELNAGGATPNIKLYGFGQTGLDIGKVAGGFKLGSAFGSKADLSALMAFCTEKGIDSYVDFNLSEFKDSGKGYTSVFSSAKTANGEMAYQYFYSKAVQTQEKDNYYRYRLLKRENLIKVSNTLLKKINGYKLTGVSFQSITDTAYSDFSSAEYEIKRNMGVDVQSIIATYKNSGYRVAASGANAYAAAVADCVFETPMNSGKNEVFSYDVPFYQIVLKGKTKITSEAVNAGETAAKKILQALETGSSVLYTITQEYDETVTYSQFKGLYNTVYSDNKESILDVAQKYSSFYKDISGQTIVEHELINENVRCTTFANGVKIYVNYSSNAVKVADGEVQAMNCLIVK